MNARLPSSMRSLLRGAFGLLRSWWQVDRVRIAPSENRLMRLRPPAAVRLGDARAIVRGRTVLQGAAAPCVRYRCETATGEAELIVPVASGVTAGAVYWVEAGRYRRIPADEVEVLARISPHFAQSTCCGTVSRALDCVRAVPSFWGDRGGKTQRHLATESCEKCGLAAPTWCGSHEN